MSLEPCAELSGVALDGGAASDVDQGKVEDVLSPQGPAGPLATGRILTQDEWKGLERENILAALRQAGGKVYGKSGAALLLGLKPTTLLSRMKALRIEKPASEDS